MLDLKFITANPELVKRSVVLKNESVDVDKILSLDNERRQLKTRIDSLRAERKKLSRQIGELIKQGKETESLKQNVKEVGSQLAEDEEKLRAVEYELKELLLRVPNIPHKSVPVGKSEDDNVVVRTWGEKPHFSFKPKDHIALGEGLGIIDFKRGAKLAGTHFPVFLAAGAHLQRALVNFMLDLHIKKHHYIEVAPPYLANRRTMTGTGQLPKLEDDMYLCERDDYFLIPTAEVPVTNLHQDEILTAAQLPLYYVAYTACFRREAGSYGKETRGLIRVHQFDKVELVKFTLPEDSYEEMEKLLNDAEEVLQLLGLHYRVVELCTAELSFAAAKCYDLEVWAPATQRWLEVSSCSNFEDFQARRSNIRLRRSAEAKLEFPHTLNASGIALPRTIIALIETYQQPDGSITIPEPLRPYMEADSIPAP
ncbi:serine--tRNA ligase [Candidatus Sumerlaeota bacterium]|nr:serine--tRNA ligase [Candidatus Sumerlaeota bacterium]